MQIKNGNHVVHADQPVWGIGRVVAITTDGLRLVVRFAGRPREETQVSTRDPSLARYRFRVGDEVKLRTESGEVVTAPVQDATRGDLDELVVDVDGAPVSVLEKNVAATPPASGIIDAILRKEWGDARNFVLRQNTLRLDDERRCDALAALFSSRVMVKPYQVAVAQRVLTDRSPRFVLADEVGLGKTIEAGMILGALLHARMARRVLVVAPSHLTVQWLAELWHKFNLRFTLMDKDRIAHDLKEAPDVDPWAGHDLVVTSLELLVRSADARDAVSEPDNRWDLIIVDEAHHLRSDRAFDVAIDLALNTWGLLLLTATPLRLDPEEYFRLLRLVESAPAQTSEEFERRLARQKELSALVNALEAPNNGKSLTGKANKVAKLFPKDTYLAGLAADVATDPDAREDLLDHLAEVYSLSSRLIRNRRVVVGGFTERKLHQVDVTPDPEAADLHREIQDALNAAQKAGTLPSGAPLSLLLRRIDSSPPAMARALEARSEPDIQRLAVRAAAMAGFAHDAKLRSLRERLREIDRGEPGAKVLVFTESKDTLNYLLHELGREGFNPLHYHGGLPTIERDRMVARFRDPDGGRLLISTEAGGEGRNFQFCHHLVHYDLPWSPSAIEQRIGRIDRVGQTMPVEVVVLRTQGTLESRVVDLMADDVQVFTDTIGGLDAIFEEVEGEILRLATFGGEHAWQEYASKLSKAIRAARKASTRDYDPLLDRKSFDRDKVRRMVDRAYERFGLSEDGLGAPEDIEEGLWEIARDLDERLEDTVLEIARRIGIDVDTDEQVDAFQCRLTFGSGLKVDALAGLDLSEEQVIEGTFWRDTAIEKEEIEYLATGHPVVEALVNFVRDGDFGRASVLRIQKGQRHGLGAVFAFTLVLPDPDDLAQGAHVPSRHAERMLESTLVRVGVELGSDGSISHANQLVTLLDDVSRARTLRPDDLPLPGDRWAQVVQGLESAAQKAAASQLEDRVANAISRLEADLMRRLDRLDLESERGDEDERELRAIEMTHEQQFADAVKDAMGRSKLVLDSACCILFEPEAPAAHRRHGARRS